MKKNQELIDREIYYMKENKKFPVVYIGKHDDKDYKFIYGGKDFIGITYLKIEDTELVKNTKLIKSSQVCFTYLTPNYDIFSKLLKILEEKNIITD